MKKIVEILIIATTLLSAHAGAKGLYEGEESEVCFKSSPDIHQVNNCISRAAENSNQKLDTLISKTSKSIKSTFVGSFDYRDPSDDFSARIGEVYSQRFLQAQDIWKRYKLELCLAVAGEIPEDSLTYEQSFDQCIMNLNKEHMAEIVAMGFEKEK